MIHPIPAGLLSARLLPLIDHPDPDVVVAAARAAAAAGAPCVEVGLRHPASREALHAAVAAVDIAVGAGTVTDADDVTAALEAGASFLVSPGATASLLAAATSAGAPWLPAASTPSEVLALRDAGASMVKLFPVGPLGGPDLVRAVAAVAPGLQLVPTGGIGPGEVAGHLAVASVVAVGGTWMFPRDAGSGTDWRRVEETVHAALELTRP